MIDVEDVPVVGQLVTALGGLLDLLVNSGDMVFVVLDFVIANLEMLLPFARTLESLAQRLPWLPAAPLEQVVTVILIALLVVQIGNVISRFGAQT